MANSSSVIIEEIYVGFTLLEHFNVLDVSVEPCLAELLFKPRFIRNHGRS
jgi:hypothetical protein